MVTAATGAMLSAGACARAPGSLRWRSRLARQPDRWPIPPEAQRAIRRAAERVAEAGADSAMP